MSQPVVISQTGVGSSSVYQRNYLVVPGVMGIQTTVSGTVTYTVEQTLEDILAADFSPSTASWSPLVGTAFTNSTSNVAGFYLAPNRGMRVRVSNGTGTVVVKFLETIVAYGR